MTEPESPPAAGGGKPKPPARPSRGRIRDNLDSFAIAILFAVAMKYFAIEAYVIPTSSMQPAMMGSEVSGVYDRILVDKFHYLLDEPDRWDIAVFRYPIRRVQSYVKRIAGLPGEQLVITGGNLYRLRPDGDPENPADLEALPRPAGVQEQHWKEIYPARIDAWNLGGSLGTAIRGDGRWEEGERGDFSIELDERRRRGTLIYSDDGRGGLVNRVTDGYPAWVAQKMIANGEDELQGAAVVQDARVRFDLVPGRELQKLEVELAVTDEDGTRTDFALVVEDGSAKLIAARGDRRSESPAVPVSLTPDRRIGITFTHVDDRLRAQVGAQTLEMETPEFRILGEIYVLDPGVSRPSDRAIARVSIGVAGRGTTRVADLTIERDLHYRPTNVSAEPYKVFAIPEGHYFMLGDNTRQSTDSRDWEALVVGVDDQGRVVPPNQPGARQLVGNFRVSDLAGAPINDENPVPILAENAIAFTDDLGDIHRLEGRPVMDDRAGMRWGAGVAAFEGVDGGEAWTADTYNVHIVPREDILGRPIVTFWPVWPWFRLGAIR